MKTPESRRDLRVRRTHKLLWEALMALLAERTFEEVTVREICDRAMVHRTTFYQHYEDKYALLGQGMRQMYDVLVAEVTLPPGAFSREHPPTYYIQMFDHVAEHRHFYRVMLCGEGTSGFQKLFRDYLVEQAEAKIYEFAPAGRKLLVPPALRAQFLAGAVISTLAWWLENDMPHSSQYMAQYLLLLQNGPCVECARLLQ